MLSLSLSKKSDDGESAAGLISIFMIIFLTLSLSLPPSLSSSCLSLYLNILFSMFTCSSGMWECVW